MEQNSVEALYQLFPEREVSNENFSDTGRPVSEEGIKVVQDQKGKYCFIDDATGKQRFKEQGRFDYADAFFKGKTVVTRGNDSFFLHNDGNLEPIDVSNQAEWDSWEKEYGEWLREMQSLSQR